MLPELAIGDAYGAGFEYADSAFVARNNTLRGYYQHPRHAIAPGAYTDDTQMTLAVAEVIVSGASWTREVLADAFVNAFKRDPREGYAQGFYHFLQEVKDGAEFLEKIRPDSDKSGAAMRACPIGIFPTIEEVLEKCTLQARLTHDTPAGIAAANAAALLTHYFLYDLGPKADVAQFLDKHVPGYEWSKPWRGKVGGMGVMSVRAAITALLARDSMSNILGTCIAFAGDVDTVATIALGAAAASKEIAQDIPDVLLDEMENEAYGKTYIQALDARLLAMKGNRTRN